MHPRTKMKVLFYLGTILIVLGIIFASCFGLIFNKILNNALVIREGSPLFEEFTAPTTPIDVNYRFFNVTNPNEIKNYGAKPILEEVGPYVYKEQYNKVNYDFDDVAGTVSYNQKYTYFYNPDKTNGTLSDKITTINAVMVLAAALGYDNFIVSELIWPEIEAGMDLFQAFTVDELLFRGFELPTFNYDLSNYPFPILNGTSNLQGTLYDILSTLGIDVPYFEDNRVGFMKWVNGTDTGLLKVNTGAKGMDEYLLVKEWNNVTSLDFWNDTYCDMINGTDGSQFHPGVKKEELLAMFSPQFCRSSYMVYDGDVVLQDVVTVNHFVVPAELLMAPSGNENNQCFCNPVPSDDTDECPPDGTVNFSPCFYGAPIVVSNPHFFDSDGTELAKFVGLSPHKELHQTYIDVEPTSGFAMSGAKKLQLNVPLRRYGKFPSFQNVPNVIFPVLWVEETAVITKEDADKFHKAMTLPFIIIYSICGVFIFVGLILVISGIVIYKKLKREPKLKK